MIYTKIGSKFLGPVLVENIVFLENPQVHWVGFAILCRMDRFSARELEYGPVSRREPFFGRKNTSDWPNRTFLGISEQKEKTKKTRSAIWSRMH